MSVVPEVLIEYVVREGLKESRRNKQMVFQIFRNAPVKLVEEFHKALLDHDIRFTLEFPRENIELPLLWLNLLTEDEDETFLGEVMGMGHGGDGVTLGDGYTYPHVGASGTAFFDSSQRESGSVDVLGGDSLYVGEAFAVNTGIDPATVTTPDAAPIIGEPAKVFDVAPEDNRVPVYEHRGQGYSASYALTILSKDSTYTIFLYQLLKIIMNRYRLQLDANGIKNLRLSGTDFGGDPELLPPQVYARSLNLFFLYFSGEIYEPKDSAKGIGIIVQPVVEGEVVDSYVIVDPNISLTSIDPSTGAQGGAITCIIDGTNIHNGAVPSFSGSGLTVSNVDYISGNRLRFDVTIDAAASLGTRDVIVTNPDGLSARLTDGFTITL